MVTLSINELTELSDEELLAVALLPELVGGVAHEVAQPLNAISLTSEVLLLKLKKLGLPDTETKFFEDKVATIKKMAFRASDTIANVRKYTSLSNGSLSDDIESSFDKVYGLLRQQFIARGINIVLKKDGSFGSVSVPSGFLDLAIGEILVVARTCVEYLESVHRADGWSYEKSISIQLLSTIDNESISISWDTGRCEFPNVISRIPSLLKLGVSALTNLMIRFDGNLELHDDGVNLIFHTVSP